MKKQISKSLSIFLALLFTGMLVGNYYFQRAEIETDEERNALATLSGIQDILLVNDKELETPTTSLRDEYIIKAQMAAYITQNMPPTSVDEYGELVALLGVDEIHLFTSDGTIYAGSEPKYWGFTFDSGEQMAFFKPMLTDTNLTMCQDITPNTAEEKPMMYIATWEEDGSNIVQIGIEPERIIEAQRKNELSYLFASMPTDSYTTLLAIDSTSGIILGASDDGYTDLNSADLGLTLSADNADGQHFYATLQGTSYFCVFTTYEDTYIGMVINETELNTSVWEISLLIGLCFLFATLFCYFVLMKMIDSWIIKDLTRLIAQVGQITGGNLDTTADVGTSPEFRELCTHLNNMVSSLLNTTAKMSHVLDYVDTNIGVYEYKKDMNRVFCTRKMGQLLDVSPEELQVLISHKTLFEGKIRSLKTHTTNQVHVYSSDDKKFLKIETLEMNADEYGVVVDVSDTVLEKMRLEHERDYDVLTDLYNRRAFFREMDKLQIQRDGATVIVALDLDNLKTINDTYGHDGGDKAIQAITSIFKQIPTTKKILARIGGDEFMLVLYGGQSQAELRAHLDLLEAHLHLAFITVAGKPLSVQVSAGYVFWEDGQLYQDLIKQADAALYSAKSHGKNKFLLYQGQIQTEDI